MPQKTKRFAWLLLGILLVCLLLPAPAVQAKKTPTETPAPAGNAYDVIAAVNALRASRGLPAYKVNDALMASAQAHSEYMASIKTLTHAGADGAGPQQRAIAWGYGNGAHAFVSENIAYGLNLSPQGAVNMWTGDNPHLLTMIGSSYQDVGAGVASDGTYTYYVLQAGYISGSAAAQTPGGPTATYAPVSTPGMAQPTSNYIQPVSVSTPQADGSIVHVVQSGQVLTWISEAYEVSLTELYQLNGLTADSVIYPGDKILIRPAHSTQAATASMSTSSPETPTATQTKAVVANQTAVISPNATATPTAMLSTTPTGNVNPAEQGKVDPLLLAIVIFLIAGISLVFIGSLLRRRI
jgi:uncharacterized protein YkwD